MHSAEGLDGHAADGRSPGVPERPPWHLTATLESVYGRQEGWSRKSPIDQLVATVLSQRTTRADERRAFDNLLARFGSWEAVADADVAGIEAEIRSSRYPELKAPRLKALLGTIVARHGSATLEHLRELSAAEAEAHDLLLAMLPPDAAEILSFHKLWFSLGQRVCHYRRPACERCPLKRDRDHARGGEDGAER